MNQLKVSEHEAIISLWQRGWSARKIARDLGVDRETITRHVKRQVAANAATPSPGSAAAGGAPPEGNATTPSAGPERAVTNAIEAPRRNLSLCENWRAEIAAGLERGFTAKRIWEDLVREQRFAGRYQSVKRFVRRLIAEAPVPTRPMEFAPGDQVQVDFGAGPWIAQEDGKRRRAHVFRAVLCCSRKGYSEATFDQKTETFLRCLENTYRHFGGVPVTTAPDNLKAAVLHPDWYDPELNPKLASFAKHYGTVVLPTKPATPRHKGRVERGIDYVKEALKGRTFTSLAAVNAFLAQWEANVADTRIHGTTRRHVGQHFVAVEKPALRALPATIFPSFTEGKRGVQLDGHVEYEKAYYSVPPEYIRREVWVRGESRVVRIFTLKMDEIVVHPRAELGRHQTADGHIHPLKRRLADHGAAYLLAACERLGPGAGAWALAVNRHRPIESMRVMMGLIALGKKHGAEDVDRAATKALQRAAWRLGDVRRALTEAPNVVQVDFLETHPLIRPMSAYRIPFPS